MNKSASEGIRSKSGRAMLITTLSSTQIPQQMSSAADNRQVHAGFLATSPQDKFSISTSSAERISLCSDAATEPTEFRRESATPTAIET